jgi:hypothetical protein
MIRRPDSPTPLHRVKSAVASQSARLAACSFAVAWFFHLHFGPTLRVTNIAWMVRGDWASYLWGFSFFRNAPWSFPLGNTPNLFYPYGTSIAFTDANPWCAVFFKVLSPLLPLDFQFSGMWFLLCFVLQALYGTLITSTMTEDKVRQALGGALFALTPLLPSRVGHIALCGFFFLTAGIYFHLKPLRSREQAVRTLWHALALLAWAAGTHGYLSVMLLALVLSWLFRVTRSDALFSWRHGSLAAVAAVGVTLGVYWLFGYVGGRPNKLTANGFGQFSGDLTALVNPQGWSRFVGSLPYSPRQYEGFLYLGTGVLLLLAVRLALVVRRHPKPLWVGRRHASMLVLTLLAMWLYSLSNYVAYRGETVLDLDGFYRHFSRLTGIFRSSGRFAWPLHLALIAAGISAACAISRAWVGRLILLVAVALQATELKADRLDFSAGDFARMRDPAWSSTRNEYRHLVMVPLNLLWVCDYDYGQVDRLAYEAYRRNLTFNSGNFMRKQAGVKKLCGVHLSPEQELDPDTIYVVDRRYLRDFSRHDAACGVLDAVTVCVSNKKRTALLTALEKTPVHPQEHQASRSRRSSSSAAATTAAVSTRNSAVPSPTRAKP